VNRFLERDPRTIHAANPNLQGYGDAVLAAMLRAHSGLGSPVGESLLVLFQR
jgi:hypothetical protein